VNYLNLNSVVIYSPSSCSKPVGYKCVCFAEHKRRYFK